jgi:hypothetical protein
LNLIADEKHIMLLTERFAFSEVTVIRDYDTASIPNEIRRVSLREIEMMENIPCFTLNRFNQESGNIRAMSIKRKLKVFNVIVPYHALLTLMLEHWSHSFQEGAEPGSTIRISAHTVALPFVSIAFTKQKAITYLIIPRVRPWKLSAALKTMAFPTGTPFFI